MRYELNGVCARYVNLEIKDDKIFDISFLGGCNGNLKAISKIINGMEIKQIIKLLDGNTCGEKKTSCVNELVKILKRI